MGYTTISTQLKTILETIFGVGNVYEYAVKGVVPTPYAEITMGPAESKPHTTHANDESYNFMVRVYYPTTDSATCERIMRKAADDIFAAYRNNVTLNASCNFTGPLKCVPLFTTDTTPQLRVLEFSVEAKQIINRT